MSVYIWKISNVNLAVFSSYEKWLEYMEQQYDCDIVVQYDESDLELDHLFFGIVLCEFETNRLFLGYTLESFVLDE